MMKLLSVSAVALSFALLVGCGKETDPAKPPGTENAPADENTFTLTLPQTATNIQQGGQAETIEISVDRGENVKGEIALTFQPPHGVTIEPANATIPSDQDSAEVAVSAAADTPIGEKPVTVMGESEGKKTEGTFNVEVTEGDDANPDNANPNPANENNE